MGRPNKLDDNLKALIKEGFSKGLNKSEVCIYVGISRPTLDSYLKQHKKFADECELLKENVKMHAKINIAEEIITNKDLSTSKYYLERTVERNEEISDNGITFKEDIPLSDSEQRFGEEDG